MQVQVITVSEQYHGYARRLVERLRSRFVRAELASESDTVSKKIRDGTTRKIPNLLIVGEREAAAGTVTLRRHGVKAQATMPCGRLRGGAPEHDREAGARIRDALSAGACRRPASTPEARAGAR